MATGKYTLLDIAARSGKNVHVLMEGVLTYAPEMIVVPTFPRAGITYTTLTRTELPAGSFRQVGGGVVLQKSAWQRQTGSMCLLEAQMQVAEDIVQVAQAEQPELATEDFLADEAMATVRGTVIAVGSQFWYGNKISQYGFAGLSTQIDTGNNQISAGTADGTNSASAYLVYLDDNAANPQGVHFLVGQGGRIQFSDTWIKQQLAVIGNASQFYMAFVNNFLAYLGLVFPRPQAAYRIKGISAGNALTDNLASQLIALIPQALMADKSKWRWFMNVQTRALLQQSRATVNIATPGNKGVASVGVFPDVPESCQGIQIVCTDSLINTERAGLHQ